MRVTMRLFAMLRQQAGWREREFELPDGASVEEAWQALVAVEPGFAAARDSARFARNGRYSSPDEILAHGDQLAIIPPVAGGAGDGDDGGAGEGRYVRCEITPEPIAEELLASLRRSVPTAADGALLLFVGQTRETSGTPAPGQEQAAARHAGQRVTRLDYEAFEEMALSTLHAIASEIEERFAVRRLVIVHRVGRVAVGEPSVVIAAAAPHREEAFGACRYAIEELKARAPIWKAEHYADGSVWIGAAAREHPLDSGNQAVRERLRRDSANAGPNEALRFVLEVAALGAMAFWGWTAFAGLARVVVTIGLPIVAALAWATFRFPGDPNPAPVAVPGVVRLALEFIVFGTAAFLLYLAGQPALAVVLAALVVAHYVIGYRRILRMTKGDITN